VITYDGVNYFNKTTGIDGELNAKRKIYYSPTPQKDVPVALTITRTRPTSIPAPTSSRSPVSSGESLLNRWISISRRNGSRRLVITSARKMRLNRYSDQDFIDFVNAGLRTGVIKKSKARMLVEARRTAIPAFDPTNSIWRRFRPRGYWDPPPRTATESRDRDFSRSGYYVVDLKKGIGAKIEEEEHGKGKKDAKEMAKDHLKESPNYYKDHKDKEKMLKKLNITIKE